MGPGILPESTVGKHNPPCHLQMPTKALSCKKEAICEHGPEAPSCPVGQGSFKWTISKCPNLDSCWNHGRRVLCAKKEGDLPVCQHSVQKPASLMVWGCISAYGMGSLHVLEGTMNAERYIKVLEHICSPPDHVYFREGLVYFSRTMQSHILQLLQQHGFVVEESGCWNWPAAVQIFHLKRTFGTSLN